MSLLNYQKKNRKERKNLQIKNIKTHKKKGKKNKRNQTDCFNWRSNVNMITKEINVILLLINVKMDGTRDNEIKRFREFKNYI